jgi:DNA-binding Xre family transcriptional regulator
VIGEDIKTVQFGWPLGMPLVRKMAKDLWEIRIHLVDRIARVLFTVVGHPPRRTRRRQAASATTQERLMNKHIGSSFDDFLAEEAVLEETTAVAIKRVVAWQIAEEMKAQHLTKTALAEKMHTSRAALNRLLDETDTSLTLTTLTSAAKALGKNLRIELTE